MAVASTHTHQQTLFGHPTGLYTLFFAEMWERFSYYGMRALLMFYMLKGFLGYGDNEAYSVYGAYVALVYMTPFFGGMLADKLLGARRAVVLGGLLMAAGHLLMTIETSFAFYGALALLIAGNGFFKPNISTIVGSLYAEGSHKRDGGFTLFYMGINLGAAMAPLLCGYVGETYGWHYGFGLATIGMLIGLAVFIVPTRVAQGLILGGAVMTASAMVYLQDDFLLLLVNGFVALALVVAGVVAFMALGKGGLPKDAGAPTNPEKLDQKLFGVLPVQAAVLLGVVVSLPVLALLVSANRTVRLVPETVISGLAGSSSAVVRVAGTFLNEIATPAGIVLFLSGAGALVYILVSAFRSTLIERQRLIVVVVLMFFSMLFWAFFEQAGSSINNFTDRNVDRVNEDRVIAASEVGQTITIPLNQEQIGRSFTGDLLVNGEVEASWTGETLLLTTLEEAREKARAGEGVVEARWRVDEEDVGMGVGGSEVPASTFQSANPIFILTFGLVFTGLWGFLGKRNLDPNIPVKFGLGLAQLALGFGVLWYAASAADPRGMVGVHWLLLGYLLHTTGELCLSPVGLSMVTRLSPARLVSTVMGAWFLATAFSGLLAGIIAQFTGVGHGEEGGIPAPIETVGIYGGVFGQIGIAAGISAVVVFALSPLLHRWMHEEVVKPDESEAGVA